MTSAQHYCEDIELTQNTFFKINNYFLISLFKISKGLSDLKHRECGNVLCVVVILIWSKFFDYRLNSWEGDKFGDKTVLCQQWWRRHTVINHEWRRRRGGPHPSLDLELLWGAMKNIICMNQRSEEGGRLTWQANERRLQPNIQIISDLIRTPLVYKSWTSQDWAERNSSESLYGQTAWPNQPHVYVL